MQQPLTVRYNNPGAVEYKPWMGSYGARPGENGRNAQFQTPDQGFGVMNRILDTYQSKHGLNTVAGIINRWAPSSVDNNSTPQYVKFVADRVGVDPNAPLTPEHRKALVEAMAHYEAGRPFPQGSPGPQPSMPPTQSTTVLPRSEPMPQPNDDMPLVGLFRNTMENPLFLAGASMFSAGSQGKDFGTGILGAMPAIQQADRMREERRRRAAVDGLLSSSSMDGVNPTILGIARATGDPSLIAQDVYRGPQMDHLRLQNDQMRQSGPLDIEAKRIALEKARRDLATPPDNIRSVKEGETLLTVDPRTGRTVQVYPAPGTPAAAESSEFRKARDKELGEARAKAIVALPQIEDNAALAFKTIEQIRSHPGKNYGLGWTGMVAPHVPGRDERGFANLVDQAKGKIFLDAFNSLRGGGAITEAEGAKATQAFSRLDRAQNARDFDAALRDIEEVITVGRERARRASGPGAAPAMVPAAPGADMPAPPVPSAPVRGAPAQVPLQAADMLRANPTPQMRQYFDQTFGPGAADRVLGGR